MNAMTVIRRAGAALLLAAAIGGLALAVAIRTDTVRVSRVLTGSMAPVVPPGALIASRPVEAGTLAPGDVVVFVPPAPFGHGTPVVHRVVDVANADGEVLVRTKGDANPAEDPWTLNASRSTVHELAWSSPFAGRATALAGSAGLASAVAALALLVAARVLLAIWRTPRGNRRAERPGLRWLRDAAA